jgi:hypothetical protein
MRIGKSLRSNLDINILKSSLKGNKLGKGLVINYVKEKLNISMSKESARAKGFSD